MADKTLIAEHTQLRTAFVSRDFNRASSVISKLKILLLERDALMPTPGTAKNVLLIAREALEIAALVSIHLRDTDSFSRYFFQLAPFYAEPGLTPPSGNKNKLVGLQLLLLLSQNSFGEFHTMLENLENGGETESDQFLKYPVMLERCLMEGSYDKVWEATRAGKVPAEEFALFSDVLIETIRNEIASCSEKAYPSLPIANAKNLFFLDSEGAVVDFARKKHWDVRDGRIYFPSEEGDREGLNSEEIIDVTLQYAKELETIV